MRHIQVIGTGCVRCTMLMKAVQDMVAQLHCEATIEKVTDLNEMLALGVMATPAVVVDGDVKSAGRIPSNQELELWLSQPADAREDATEPSAGANAAAAKPCCGEPPLKPEPCCGAAPVASTPEPCCGASRASVEPVDACCNSAQGEPKQTVACCGAPPPEKDWSQEPDDAPWVVGQVEMPSGTIPRVSTTLGWADRLGSWKARWGMGRMHYWVKPRLYAVGMPDAEAPVFVTANYKMSFDRLRSALAGRDGWILVLDTQGINVWCAAGKGSFGTDELVHRIEQTGLANIVSHRRLIVPQLGAVGVAAHEVRKQSGFHVQYGPVCADDIPAYLGAGMKASPEMRRVEFPLWDRLSVAVVDLVLSAKYVLVIAVVLVLLGGLGTDGFSLWRMLSTGGFAAALFLAAFLCGTVLGPALLPELPGRAFSLKGVWIGIALAAMLWLLSAFAPNWSPGWISLAAWTFMLPVVTSFAVLNYTGSTTFTSLSGVRREMRRAVPLQAIGAVIGISLWLIGRFV